MQTLRNLSKIGVCLFVALTLYGCSATPNSSEAVAANTGLNSQKFNQLVSRDVASVLRQIDSLSPDTTTLGLSRDTVQEDEFAAALDRELQANGYAMRSSGSSFNALPVSYSFSNVSANQRNSSDVIAQVVTVNVGDVAVRRSYAMDTDNNVRPLGEMSVRGADASRLVNDDDIFTPIDGRNSNKPKKRPPLPQLVADVQKTQTNQAQAIVSQSTNGPAQNSSFTGELNEPNALALQLPKTSTPKSLANSSVNSSANVPRPSVNPNNIRSTLISNFESELVDTLIVKEKVLTFANDSIRMGSNNKAQVAALLQGFNPDSDVVSIIGCSHGNTSVVGGQEALALGRAERVRDELLFSGIPDKNILAEGCWAGEHFDGGMPRRGVVISLRRKVG